MTAYTSPPDPTGFQVLVWEIARQIPPGKVSTYGQIASMIPPPEGVSAEHFRARAAQWVGGAMAACPENVPWQRVINAQGKISVRKGGGHLRQKALLEKEGIVFDERGRVDFSKVGWAGPDEDWLAERGLRQPQPLGRPAAPQQPELPL